MSATATEPPLELIKTRTNDYWLKPLEQCLPITLSGVTTPWTNETNDGMFENYKPVALSLDCSIQPSSEFTKV
jgi:hypothetical protein